MAVFISIDAGTSFLKIAAYNESGGILSSESFGFGDIKIRGSFYEFEIESYWTRCLGCLKNVCLKLGDQKKEIKSISVSSQGTTFVFLDKKGKVLAPAVSWMDSRGKKESEYIMENLSKDLFYNITGQPDLNSNYLPAKILWFINHKPNIIDKSRYLIFLGDYLIYRLSNAISTSYSLASVSGILDIYKKKWSREILKLIKFNEQLFPVFYESGQPISKVNSNITEETGMPATVNVMSSALDQAASAIGSGNFKPGIITETTGSVLALATVISKNRQKLKAKIPIFYHACPDTLILIAWHQNGGLLLDWFKNAFASSYLNSEKPAEDIFKLMDIEADSVLPGSDELLFLPHLYGAGFPYHNENAHAVFYDIKPGHKRAHFVRAILESLGYEILNMLKLFKENNISWSDFYCVGGGSNSKTWLQIKADIIQHRINILNTRSDIGTLGMAMLSAISLGYYSNLSEAFLNMNRIKEIITPNKKLKKVYVEGFGKYKALNKLLINIF
ncbi:MAG: FGGY family carbohydrate kinase [Actinobacteria bacterium]|nr:FGGY family carbohydrate kinase [Actinomycetota bacterium]